MKQFSWRFFALTCQGFKFPALKNWGGKFKSHYVTKKRQTSGKIRLTAQT
jgi:hypothetical protein